MSVRGVPDKARATPAQGQLPGTRISAVHDDTRCKIAFIGSHGVGKTTLAFGLAARLKARDVSLDVVHEVARRCPLPINEETSLAAQSWILHTQVAEELVAAARYPVVLCDRSVLDNYVYLLLAAGEQAPLTALVDEWMSSYGLLVHVPIVGGLLPDGIRAADPAFQRLVDERLGREIERRALAPLRLDPAAPEGWHEQVEAAAWRALRPAQLPLL
jgi:nicotinamide riboside kinase